MIKQNGLRSIIHRIASNIAYKALPKPKGEVIKGSDARGVIYKWEQKAEGLRSRASDIQETRTMIDTRLISIKNEIAQAIETKKEATKSYHSVKTKKAKERWARRIVSSHNLLTYLQQSQVTLRHNIDRAEVAIEDCRTFAQLIQAKARDAEIYYRLNGEIRLIGSAMALAETVDLKAQEYERDFEVGAEQTEDFINAAISKDPITAAEAILGGK